MDKARKLMLISYDDPHIMVPGAQRYDVRENLSTAHAMGLAGARIK